MCGCGLYIIEWLVGGVFEEGQPLEDNWNTAMAAAGFIMAQLPPRYGEGVCQCVCVE